MNRVSREKKNDLQNDWRLKMPFCENKGGALENDPPLFLKEEK